MNLFIFLFMSASLAFFAEGSHAQARTDVPLDLTVRGVAVRPQLMLDRKEENKPEDRTLPFADAKNHAIVIPAIQMRSGETTLTVGVRLRTDGAKIQLRAIWP